MAKQTAAAATEAIPNPPANPDLAAALAGGPALAAAPPPARQEVRVVLAQSLRHGRDRDLVRSAAGSQRRQKPLMQRCSDCQSLHNEFQCPICSSYCLAQRGIHYECCRCHKIVLTRDET